MYHKENITGKDRAFESTKKKEEKNCLFLSLLKLGWVEIKMGGAGLSLLMGGSWPLSFSPTAADLRRYYISDIFPSVEKQKDQSKEAYIYISTEQLQAMQILKDIS